MLYASLLVFFHVRLTAVKFKQGGSQGFDTDSCSLPKPSSHLLYTFHFIYLQFIKHITHVNLYCQDISDAAVFIRDPQSSFPFVVHPIPIVLPRINWGSHSPQCPNLMVIASVSKPRPNSSFFTQFNRLFSIFRASQNSECIFIGKLSKQKLQKIYTLISNFQIWFEMEKVDQESKKKTFV